MAIGDLLSAVPFAAYAVSGLLVVLVQPRNTSARLLAAAGVLLPLARALEDLAVDAWGSWRDLLWVEWAVDASFLLGLACLVAAVTRFPDGRQTTRAGRWTERSVAAAAATASVGLLAGGPLEPAARAVAGTEPLWALAAVVVLVRRYLRSGPQERRQTRWPVRSLGALAAVLLVALLSPGDPEWTGPVFLVALALFPVSLAVGVATRARQVESDLLLSRTRLVTAEDAASRRLERDLHDGVQQQLVGLLSLVQLAQRQQQRADPATGTTLAQAAREAQRTMTDLRDLASGIHPSVLTDCGLAEAVDSRLSLLPHAVELRNRLGGRRWPPATEAAAYFLVCELLTNAVKHSGCERIVVDLADDVGGLDVTVSDDGRGFDATGVRSTTGLQGLHDRVEALGGRVTVTSSPTSGTTVCASFPGASS